MSQPSLEDRLAALLATSAGHDAEEAYDLEDMPEGADEEELVEVSEQEALRHLDAMNPPLEFCGRLFFPDGPRAKFQVLPQDAAASLRSRGYAIIDGACDPALSDSLRADALRLHADGAFASPPSHAGFTDTTARHDEIMWIRHESDAMTGSPGLRAGVALLLALRDDVGSLLELRRGQVWGREEFGMGDEQMRCSSLLHTTCMPPGHRRKSNLRSTPLAVPHTTAATETPSPTTARRTTSGGSLQSCVSAVEATGGEIVETGGYLHWKRGTRSNAATCQMQLTPTGTSLLMAAGSGCSPREASRRRM